MRRIGSNSSTPCGPARAPNGDGRVGHAEGGGADGRDRDAALAGHDRQRIDVAGLALVGAHAGGGVALDVLDRLEALAHGEAEVLGGDVVLEVDERLGARGRPRLGTDPGGSSGPAAGSRTSGLCGVAAVKPAARAASRAGACTLRQSMPPGQAAVGGAGRTLGLRPTGPARTRPAASSKRSLPRDCENRCTVGFQPPDISRQSQRSAWARGWPRLPSAAAARPRRWAIRRRPSVPTTADPRRMRQPGCRRPRRGSVAVVSCAQVDDRLDRDAGAREVERGGIGAVIVGEHDRRGCPGGTA